MKNKVTTTKTCLLSTKIPWQKNFRKPKHLGHKTRATLIPHLHSAMLKSWLCVSMSFHTACFVSLEVALGTPPGFEKLKHVLEITFGFAEEMSGCVLLMTNATDVLVVY